MTPNPIPTNLKAYFCENCHTLFITNETIEINENNSLTCFHCNQDTFVLLDNQLYSQNFNPEAFPFPQSFLLQRFFENSENINSLFTELSQITPIGAWVGDFESLDDITTFQILITPDLQVTATCNLVDNTYSQIKGPIGYIVPLIESES
ncbi:MAG: hypothetical protein WBM32_03330 [Crocosphaera sp.]|jgi:hypothetical protein